MEKKEKDCKSTVKRKINKFTITNFLWKLSHESWEQVFQGNDVNMIFNTFLNIFLRIYNSSFPLTLVKNKMTQNSWITTGIITSCKHKRELYNYRIIRRPPLPLIIGITPKYCLGL